MDVIFKTVHGSRLYGLAHENSDEDFYTVVIPPRRNGLPGRQPKAKYAKQNITGNEDSTVVGFGTWIEMCKSGVPQALEAMYSDMVIEDRIPNLRKAFRAGPACWPKYLDTIKSFSHSEKDAFKRKRHALRLALNLNEMARTGRFNPTLTPDDANFITELAKLNDADTVYEIAKILVWR
jgi:predicted nucleotidyltransferase